MANWINEIDIVDIWNKPINEEYTIQQLSKDIAEKLSNINYKNSNIENEKRDLIDCFLDLSTQEELTDKEFDSLMDELYNWADQSLDSNKNVCWIKTI